jgi:hypothetical protein
VTTVENTTGAFQRIDQVFAGSGTTGTITSAASEEDKFLRGDGQWVNHPGFLGSGTTGTVTSAAGDAGKYLYADGTWRGLTSSNGGDFRADGSVSMSSNLNLGANGITNGFGDFTNLYVNGVSLPDLTNGWNLGSAQAAFASNLAYAVSVETQAWNSGAAQASYASNLAYDISVATNGWNLGVAHALFASNLAYAISLETQAWTTGSAQALWASNTAWWGSNAVVNIQDWTNGMAGWTNSIDMFTNATVVSLFDLSYWTNAMSGWTNSVDLFTNATLASLSDLSFWTNSVTDYTNLIRAATNALDGRVASLEGYSNTVANATNSLVWRSDTNGWEVGSHAAFLTDGSLYATAAQGVAATNAQGRVSVVEGVTNTLLLTNDTRVATLPSLNRMSNTWVDSSGNVGVGISAPLSTVSLRKTRSTNDHTILDIGHMGVGGGGATAGVNGDTVNMVFYGNGSGGTPRQRAKISGITQDNGSGLGALSFSTATATDTQTEKMRITSAGDVSIGTNSPSARLHVYGGNIFHQSATGDAGYYFGNADGSADAKYSYISGSSGGYITFGKVNDALSTKTEYMRIAGGTGNVGIGTNAPGAKLDVNGGAIFRGPSTNLANFFVRGPSHSYIYFDSDAANSQVALAFRDQGSDKGSVAWEDGSRGNKMAINSAGTGGIEFSQGGNLTLKCDQNRNVGIGTNTPGAKLDCNGSAIVRGTLTVTGTNVLDFLRAKKAVVDGDLTQMYASGTTNKLIPYSEVGLGITITNILVQSSVADPTTELSADLMYCDNRGTGAFPAANQTVVTSLATTTGNYDSGMITNSIATGKELYLRINADPVDINQTWTITVSYTVN